MQNIIIMDWILLLGSLSWPVSCGCQSCGQHGLEVGLGLLALAEVGQQSSLPSSKYYLHQLKVSSSAVLIILSDLLGGVPVLVQQPSQHLQQGHGGGGGGVDYVDSPPQTVLSSYLWQLTNCVVLWCCEHWQSADNQYNECGAAQHSCNVVFVSYNIAFRSMIIGNGNTLMCSV